MKKTILAASFLVALAVATRASVPTADAAVNAPAVNPDCEVVCLATGQVFSTLRACVNNPACKSGCDILCPGP
jgi:hypothetical protein